LAGIDKEVVEVLSLYVVSDTGAGPVRECLANRAEVNSCGRVFLHIQLQVFRGPDFA